MSAWECLIGRTSAYYNVVVGPPVGTVVVGDEVGELGSERGSKGRRIAGEPRRGVPHLRETFVVGGMVW